jgi:hypothetical protein
MWENAYKNKALPKEWTRWEDFRAWVLANQYKAEYGYKGEFTPDGCLKAIPGKEPDFNSLMRLKLDELKQLALEKGIEAGETKREIANQILGGE